MNSVYENRRYQNFINATNEDISMKEFQSYEEEMAKLSKEAIDEGRATPLVVDHPGTHHLEIAFNSDKMWDIESRDPLRLLYMGALAALQVLGANPVLGRDDLDELARQMIDEARFHLR
jgi:hypothetical protein